MEFDPRNPLEIREGDVLKKYFDVELDFMVDPNYYKQENFIVIRSIAILDIDEYACGERDAFVPYLAINFVDRFLSRNLNIPVILPGQGYKKNVELFAFCCFTIASKIRSSHFSVIDFLDEHQVAEVKDVSVMELQILEGLNQRVQPVTPITFIYFIHPLLKTTPDDQKSFPKTFASRILWEIQRDIRFTKFRPSTLAASAILASFYVIQPGLYSKFLNVISKLGFFQMSEVEDCFEEMKEYAKPGRMRNPDTPKGVYLNLQMVERRRKAYDDTE